ncbi:MULTISPECIES: hypothetical protein [unclassified Thermosynechococcus]|uniref:hypothetical protein n=1 Tax=unclassified Thermosynechococcus TaxID=2622553 RepID=UPI0026741BD5|nr:MULTISPECIES: hypothetical protein [unclassified Thermosynechococcus]WKT83896.1 hypothetical protein QYC28_00870 [Thermosynechococcus sp. HY596]WNC63027.1 hypothetical protein RHK13_00870 [Thermosynechococcus sp. HY591]WNC65587.1 hypothetical protein RHK28_00875 [Thermosynechococcus sp. HY593]
MLQMSATGHTLVGTYALIGFTISGLSFLRAWVQRQYKGSVQRLKEECDRLHRIVSEQAQRIEGLKELVSRSEQERDRQRQEIEQLRSEVERLQNRCQELEDQQQQLRTQVSDYRQQVAELTHALNTSQAENEALRDNCDRYRQELETAYQRSSSLEEEYASQTATLTASLTTIEATCREKEAELAACHATVSERDREIDELHHEIADLNQEVEQLQQTIDHLQTQKQGANIYAQWLTWLSSTVAIATLVLNLGPWSPLWAAVYSHLPMFS